MDAKISQHLSLHVLNSFEICRPIGSAAAYFMEVSKVFPKTNNYQDVEKQEKFNKSVPS